MLNKTYRLLLLLASGFTFNESSAQGNPGSFIVTVHMAKHINKPGGDTIFYDLARPLTWEDFQGKPVESHFGGAVTASGYAFNADIKGDRNVIYLDLEIYTFFNKSESWKKKGIQTPYHLQHEQLHFDITRIGAESFLKELSKARFTKDNYSRLINELFDKTYGETTRLQQKYDRETEHSINTPAQLKWNELIAAEIKKL